MYYSHGLYLVAVSLPVNVPQSLCCGSPSHVDVPQSLCCGSPARWMCHSLYVAVLPPCECATVFMLRFSRPVDVPQSLCCGSPALRKCHSLYAEVLPALWMCHSLYVLSNTHDAIRYFRPAIAQVVDGPRLSFFVPFLLGGSVHLAEFV
jgi:hypothetical protein